MDKKIFFLLLLLGAFACSHRKYLKVETTVLTIDTTFTELSDSSFVPARVMCMDTNGDELYYSDYKKGNVIVLDKKWNLKRRIGSRGEGPGELLGAAHFCMGKNDSVYILNEGKQALELYVKDEYVKHIPFPSETSFTFATRFFTESQSIYHSIVSDSLFVVVFDENSSINRFICSNTTWDKPDFKRHSTRHLIKGDAFFFVVGCALPIFQMYSFDWKLMKEYNLEKTPEINKTVKQYRNTPQTPTTYYTIIQDVYYRDGKVYLLVSTNENEYFCNTVCVLDISEEIKHINTFKLKGDVYESFCVTENNILAAFNTSEASMDIFTLPE
jgi:hypothetical protein